MNQDISIVSGVVTVDITLSDPCTALRVKISHLGRSSAHFNFFPFDRRISQVSLNVSSLIQELRKIGVPMLERRLVLHWLTVATGLEDEESEESNSSPYWALICALREQRKA